MTDVNARDRAGGTVLHQAAVHGRLAEVEQLLASGADAGAADKRGFTPLHLAAMQGHLEVSRLLLAAGAPVNARDAYGNGPLWRAVFGFPYGQPDLIRLLLDVGADPDWTNVAGRSPREMGLLMGRSGIEMVFPRDIPAR